MAELTKTEAETTTGSRPVRTLGAAVMAVLVLGAGLALSVAALGVAAAEPAAAQCAPRISVSKTANLAAGGETVNVSGTCFDVNKGIYVAFCVVPAPGSAPTPCGGGVDMSGAGGLSHWISSNPPPYGVGVAIPYGPGGSFTVSMHPSATLNPTVDCRRVRCAIVTRNDHTRTSDRGQDVIVPVTFAADPASPVPPLQLPVIPAPPAVPDLSGLVTTTTAPPETTTTPVPETTTTTASTEDTLSTQAADGGDELAVDTVASSGGSSGPSGGLIAGLVVAVLLVLGAGGWFFARQRSGATTSGSDGPGGEV